MSRRLLLLGGAALLACCLAGTAQAKDYGIMGATFPIAEPDLLEVIRARLLRAQQLGELDRMNQKFVETAQAAVRRPKPVAGITPAKETREWLFDPGITISEDIRDAKGNMMAAKGQRFNPLHYVGLHRSFAFIDGDSPEEMAWALAQGDPDKLWIVMVKGSPLDRMKELKRRFYFDQQGVLTGRFGITHTPALLTRKGDGLEIREVALARKEALH